MIIDLIIIILEKTGLFRYPVFFSFFFIIFVFFSWTFRDLRSVERS